MAVARLCKLPRQVGANMLSATLGPPVTTQRPDPLPPAGTEQHIPIHRLQGQQKTCANRLLALFRGKAIQGVEWSLKFQAAGLYNERFLLGLHRDHWHDFEFSNLPTQLAMPPDLWAAFQFDLSQAVMFYAAFEAIDDVVFYRVYLELPAGADPQLAGVHGSGYKWNPLLDDQGVVTRYRERTFQDAAHARTEIYRHFNRMDNAAIRQAAQDIFNQAIKTGDPSNFLFLDVDETASQRSSFTLTFNGVDVAVQNCVPVLIRLAHDLALPEGDVVRAFLPDDPRLVRSIAMGTSRDGNDFFTFYYG